MLDGRLLVVRVLELASASRYPSNTVFNIGQFKASLRWLEHWHCRSFSLTVIGSQ